MSLSNVEDRLAEWLGREGDVAVSTVPADGEIWVRLRARGATLEAATAALDAMESRVAAALGDDCYSRDGETLEQVVGHRLRARGFTVSTAESCTGGLVGHRLTNVAGSSEPTISATSARLRDRFSLDPARSARRATTKAPAL